AASNLVAGDTNARIDVFVHDRDADGNGVFDEPGGVATVRTSVDSAGGQADGASRAPAMSADGRFVAFESSATNLLPGDTNGADDVFIHDRDADGNGIFDEPGGVTTTRVSVSTAGVQGDDFSAAAALSADGQIVAFHSAATNLVGGDTNGVEDVYVHDLVTGLTARASVGSGGAAGNNISDNPALSADGRFLAFGSAASTLVANDSNLATDVFVHGPGTAGPDLTGDGDLDDTVLGVLDPAAGPDELPPRCPAAAVAVADGMAAFLRPEQAGP